MKLYTKTGDKGQTGLIGGTRVSKNDIRIEAYGTVDELNSFIGLLTVQEIPDVDRAFLRYIQNQLFAVGSHLATDQSITTLHKASVLSEDDIRAVEEEIDRIDQLLPALSSFVLPGGSQIGALSHICRTITRRAERRIYDMDEVYSVDIQIHKFFNRLSDYFFALSRYLTLQTGGEEIYWKKHD